MNFFGFAILLFVGFFISGGSTFDKLTPKELTSLANRLKSPFSKISAERLKGRTFGSDRSARSSDCVIINSSKYNFKLDSSECSLGVFNTKLFPEKFINSKQSSVYGYQSDGYMSGADCGLKYTSKDGAGAYLKIRSSSPYYESPEGSESHSSTIKVTLEMSSEDHNQVLLYINNK